jgi:excisionase family DNA binding protein
MSRQRATTQNRNQGVAAAPRFFTIGDIATSLDVSNRTVRRWIAGGTLAAHRFTGVVRISERDLLAFLAVHRHG